MRWTGVFLRLVAVGTTLASLASSAAVPTRGWTLIDIGTLGGPGSYGAAISNNGHVTGCADVASGGAHAFIYTDGTIRDLGGGDTAGGSSCGLAVNNQGLVAGRSTTGELVIWTGSTVQHLGVLGDIGGMDEAGAVVGAYRQGAATRAFVFANGALNDLGALGGDTNSAASRINSRGQIVGSSNGRAFLYENAAMRDLGTLGGNNSSAKGINDRGEIVGMAANANGQPGPFLFDGTMRPLPGPGYSGAIAINNRGQVIGSAEGTYGYLIDGDTYTRLDLLAAVREQGWRHLEPTGINDRGWIVGSALNPAGDLRAFLLIPIGPSSSRAPSRR